MYNVIHYMTHCFTFLLNTVLGQAGTLEFAKCLKDIVTVLLRKEVRRICSTSIYIYIYK